MGKTTANGHARFAILGLAQLAAVMVVFGLIHDLATRYMPDIYPLLFGGAVALGLIFRILLIRYRKWRQDDRLFVLGLVWVSVLFVVPASLLPLFLAQSTLATLEAATGMVAVATTMTAFVTCLIYGIEPEKVT